MDYIAQMLLKSNQEPDITNLINYLIQTARYQLGIQSAGFYWSFNQEWYFSAEIDSALSKHVCEMSISLIKDNHQANQDLVIAVPMPEHQCHASFIPIYLQHKLLGMLCLIAASEYNELATKKIEISIFSCHLASVISHAMAQVKIKEHYYEVTRGMIAIIESLDPYLRDHSKNVANYSLLLTKELHVAPSDAETIYYAALFHDIGKVGIPLALLQKPGALTTEEFDIIKQHPEKGAHILEQFSVFRPMVPMVRHHHEMFEGDGYPDGLKEDAIPFGSRIIAVVDAYDALTTNRVYRKAQGEKSAIEIIQKNTPQQFDPIIVDAFIRLAKNL